MTPIPQQSTAQVKQPVQWLESARIPRSAAALMAALSFCEDHRQLGRAILRSLPDSEWVKVLEFTNAGAITLLAGTLIHDDLPCCVRERIARDTLRNTARLNRLRSELAAVSGQLKAERIGFLLIKGFSLGSEYCLDPRLRMHYDFDLFSPQDAVQHAYRAILSLGYEPVPGENDLAADHLAPLMRKTGWRWQGDPFDPEIPPEVELHFRFWDEDTERLAAPGVEEFWQRRVEQSGIPVLHPPDQLAYAALHLLRHLFRGSLRVNHVYEVARFLDTQASNDAFWSQWCRLHSQPLRQLEAVAFQLAAEWFGCHIAANAGEEVARLPRHVQLWFDKYAGSPVESLFHPNKHELWLHLALLNSARDRCKIVARKLFPLTLPPACSDVYIPPSEFTIRLRLAQGIRYAVHLVLRATHHACTLPITLWHGALWQMQTSELDTPFWWFSLGGAIYAFGFFVFYLLYNLLLLDRGYNEDALGLIAGGLTLGSMAGVLPAASFVRRVGLGPALKVAAIAIPALFASRCVFSSETALIISAFVAGAASSLWAVAYSPAVAALTSERSRPAGFAIANSSSIGVGMLAGLIGGRVPHWILGAHLVPDGLHAKQLALLASATFAALSLWPLSKLRLQSAGTKETRAYPHGRFIRNFLMAISVWSLATGAFNPLFNAYFERRFRMSLESIGIVFAFSHLGQVATVLLSPLILRRLGLERGVACIQLITALTLGSMAAGPSAYAAATLYVAYMSFQYMGDPGTNSLLMNNVKPAHRSGAAALLVLVTSLAQALAAFGAGAVVARYGYQPMLAGAAVLAVSSAYLFWRLLRGSDAISGSELLPAIARTLPGTE